MADAQGEQSPAQENSNAEQASPIPESIINEENFMVLHALAHKNSEENTSK
nr:hypothetical protein [Tanacetum cinerariifolium]